MLGVNAAEVALTKHLSQTLVKTEVMEPMAANGWAQGAPPSPQQAAIILAERGRANGATEEQISAFLAERGVKYTPPAGGQPVQTEGAPTPVTTTQQTQQSGPPATPQTPPSTPAVKTDASLADKANDVLAQFEALKGPDGKYMGKYNSLFEALNGAGHLANMAKSALARADQLEAQLKAAPGQPIVAPPAAAPAAAPAKPFTPPSHATLELAKARLDKVLSKVNESGFDGDSAREYAEATREVAREEARAVAADAQAREEYERETESRRWAETNRYMAENYPESQNVNDDEFNLFLRMNPLLTDAMSALRVQGRETRAAELGYTEFVKARGSLPVAPGDNSRADAVRTEQDLAERERVRVELRDQALKDAGVVHGSAGGNGAAETPGITGPSQDEINSAAARMRREGEAPGSQSAAEWRHMTIGRFLPPEIFGHR